MSIPIAIEAVPCTVESPQDTGPLEQRICGELGRLSRQYPHSRLVLVQLQDDWFSNLCAKAAAEMGTLVVQSHEDARAEQGYGDLFAVDGLGGGRAHAQIEYYRETALVSSIISEALVRTDNFNADCTTLSQESAGADVFSQSLSDVRDEADVLSLYFQRYYLSSMLLLSVCCVLLVLAFLLYDEAELRLMLVAYGIVIVSYAALYRMVLLGGFHERYIQYRVLAETLRVQSHLASLGIAGNVADNFPWTQRGDVAWARAAVGSLLSCSEETPICTEDEVKAEWIDGQVAYHRRAYERENEKAQVNDRIVAATLALTVVVYVLTCVLEAFFPQVMPIEVLSVSICSWLKISLGCISAVALFVSGYYGSLSIERKAHDHRRMSMLFERAAEVYEREPETRRELFKRLAREEIIENGTWMSYCNENRPTFNL